MKKLVVLLGRICLSLIFVSSAVGKLFTWDQTSQYMTLSLSKWTSVHLPQLVEQGVSFLSTHAGLFLIISTLLEGIGGLFVLLGFNVRLGAVMLILFLIPITVLMHPFWMESGLDKMLQMTMFMKNLSILGGVMILAAKSEESGS